MARLILELNKESLGGWLYSYADINFLHFAILLFVICCAVLIIVSLLTGIPSKEKYEGITYSTKNMGEPLPENPVWKKRDIVLSVLLIIIIGLVWIYFSG